MNGQYFKKIRGRFFYFGTDADAALEEYRKVKDDLLAGKSPAVADDPNAVTIRLICNRFLACKMDRLQSGDLGQRTYDQYVEACTLLGRTFGKTKPVADLRSHDFAQLRNKMAKRWGPERMGNAIQSIRSVFKFAFEEGLIAAPPLPPPTYANPPGVPSRRSLCSSIANPRRAAACPFNLLYKPST
jgi:hypothetical protein